MKYNCSIANYYYPIKNTEKKGVETIFTEKANFMTTKKWHMELNIKFLKNWNCIINISNLDMCISFIFIFKVFLLQNNYTYVLI